MIGNFWLWVLNGIGLVASGLIIAAMVYLFIQACFEIRDVWRARK